MQSYRDRLSELVLDLCWSLWVELGISGWQRRHQDVEIDLEPLILFTTSIQERDPRLRDEVAEWCASHSRWVSVTRLRNLAPADADRNSWSFVREHTEGRPSSAPDFFRPALIQLRLRGLFGVSARAEIFRLMLRSPAEARSAAELAPEAGSSKRNIAEALDGLRLAGFVEAIPIGNRIRFRLSRPAELGALVGLRPAESFSWITRLRLLRAMLDLADATLAAEQIDAAVEAARLLHDMADEIGLADARGAPNRVTGRDLWPAFEAWSLGLVSEWARVSPARAAPRGE